jgi:hypothetical protein
MEPVQLTPEELYEAVWTERARTLAKRYNTEAVVEVATSVAYQKLAFTRS